MISNYPSNVVEYNQFRFTSLDSVDENDLVVFVGTFPRDMTEIIFGALSLLYEPYCWTEGATLSREEMVDLAVKWVRCMEFDCGIIADCILNSTEVQEALREIISDNTIIYDVDNVQGSETGNALDCIWGGVVKLVTYTNAEIISLMDTLAASADFLEDILNTFPTAKIIPSQKLVVALAGFVPSVLSALYDDPDWLTDRACELFCLQIATANPQVMLVDTIETWLNNLIDITPDDETIWALSVQTTVSLSAMLKQFAFGQDECNNDWQLCSCITSDEFTVPATTSTPTTSTLTLANGVSYVVSVEGTYVYNAGGDLSDTVYRQVSGTWKTPADANTLRFDTGSGFYQPDTPSTVRSEGGYSWIVVGEGNTLDVYVYDSDYGDNSGQVTINIATAS